MVSYGQLEHGQSGDQMTLQEETCDEASLVLPSDRRKISSSGRKGKFLNRCVLALILYATV
jgi:hypothetical protein